MRSWRRRRVVLTGVALLIACVTGMVVNWRNSRDEAPQLAYGLRRWSIPELKLDLVWLEPRTFTMGDSAEDLRPASGEIEHIVRLTEGFWIATTEVTQAQFEAVMKLNPSANKGNSLPVESVSWVDANDFCKKLEALLLAKDRRRRRVRLPTESEWEYACRAGT